MNILEGQIEENRSQFFYFISLNVAEKMRQKSSHVKIPKYPVSATFSI